jgi:hypothetical protein
MIVKGVFCALFIGVTAQTPQPGIWDIWSDWTNCTETCGPGTHNRTRECVDEEGEQVVLPYKRNNI